MLGGEATGKQSMVTAGKTAFLNNKQMKKSLGVIAASLLFTGRGGIPEIKVSAKDRNKLLDRRKPTPPRSMTEEELAYYKKHKKLS